MKYHYFDRFFTYSPSLCVFIWRIVVLGYPSCQTGSLTGAVHLLNDNAGVLSTNRNRESRRCFLILRCRLFLSLRSRIRQALDCSPTNRERELGLDRRETVIGNDKLRPDSMRGND
ncbi:GPI mannosyltransferase [Trichinella spiralis]|uniref:GPI mannosyltransferase n=1 Tax=Trichinella spiralis TaxID=6334 RepID=A0ABR3KNJ0_TRISP